MRPHCGTGQRTGTAGTRRSTQHAAHRTTASGGIDGRIVEPARGRDAPRVVAVAHERVQPLLSGRDCAPDRLWRGTGSWTHAARTTGAARLADLARGDRRNRNEPGPQRQLEPD